METTENGENILNTYESKIESNEKGIDEIVILYMQDNWNIFFNIFMSIVFICCPFIFYFGLIHGGYKKVVVIDKKREALIIGERGILSSCSCCCLFRKKTFFLNEIKNVKIQVTSKDDPEIGFGKLYYINGYIYTQSDKCETLFEDIEYTNEKFNKFVSFFKNYIPTIDEYKNKKKKTPKDNNDYPRKSEINEDAAMHITP